MNRGLSKPYNRIMKNFFKTAFLLTLVLTLAAGCSRRQVPVNSNSATASSSINYGIQLTNMKVLSQSAGRVDWSGTNNLIIYDRLDSDGYWQLWTMQPDGSQNTCLTCSASALPGLNVGNPSWSPDGKFIVFQSEDPPSHGRALDKYDFPGSGWNNDLWATDAHGHFWQLTNSGTGGGGVITPTFSWDGKTLSWGQRVSANPSPFGSWELAIGEFTVSADGTPSVSKIKYRVPGTNHYYYEPHSFSLDNKTLFFMGNLQPGMGQLDMDIYAYNLDTGDLKDLTNTPGDWSEYPQTMPYGNKLVYMSTAGNYRSGNGQHAYCDLWVMNYDGSNKQRLTFFNDPGSPQYISSGVCLDDHAWNVAATQLVVYDNQVAANRGAGIPGEMWLFDAKTIRQP